MIARLLRTCTFACAIAALSCSVFSQNTTITKAEFDKAWRSAQAASRKKAVQVTTDISVSNDGNIISADKNIEQFLAPDRMRSFTLFSSGAKVWKEETIEVGDNGFTRKDNEKWLEYPVTDRVRIKVPASILPPNWDDENSRLTFYVTDSIVDGQTARVFSAEKQDETQDETYERDETNSVWISVDGLILKTESVEIDKVKSNVRTKRTVSIWSYDPFAFKIEAPVIQ